MPIHQDKWLVSYETLLFDTNDGDLGMNDYALDGNGKGYYIRTVPQSQGHFEHVDLTYDVSGKQLVNIILGHAYYDEFLTAAGQRALASNPNRLLPSAVLRLKTTAAKYSALGAVKNYPQPTHSEDVDTLPPPIPERSVLGHAPHNLPHSIGFDATSNSGAKDAVSSYSFSHTCGASANLLVFGDALQVNGTTAVTVSGVTYNASALTLVRSDRDASASYWSRSTIYYMLAPATGAAYTVAVTYTATNLLGGGGVVSYSGALQSGQPDAHNGATNTGGTNLSVSVTTVADNCWLFSVCYANGNIATCGQTQRWALGGNRGGSDFGPQTPAGAKAMTWTQTFDNSWSISAASFSPTLPTDNPITASVALGLSV